MPQRRSDEAQQIAALPGTGACVARAKPRVPDAGWTARLSTSRSSMPGFGPLDRSLVDGLSQDPVLSTLVRSLVSFGHGSGAQIVAEGVETAER